MKRLIILFSISIGLIIAGCSSEDGEHSHGEDADHTHEQTAQQSEKTAHSHDGESEHEGEHSHESEESDMQLGLDETYDQLRRGTRLILSYNKETGSFTGSVQNTTEEMLPQIRVEVHLSNGTELGPTTPVDLDPGQSQSIELSADGEEFDRWTAHAEIGSGEHSHGEDGEPHEHN